MSKIKFRRAKRFILERRTKIIVTFIISLFFLFTTGYAIMSTTMSISGNAQIADEVEETCSYNITGTLDTINTWQDSTNGNMIHYKRIIIENNGDETINGWTMRIKGPSDLDCTLVNANVVLEADGSWTLTNYDWNGTITPGNSLTLEIGFTTVEETLNLEYIYFQDCKFYSDNQSVNPGYETTTTTTEDPTVLQELVLTPTNASVRIGQTITLEAVKVPTTAVCTILWSTSDANVATVDNGVVTGISEGNATVSATCGSITRSTAIRVTDGSTVIGDDSVTLEFIVPYYWAEGRNVQFTINIENLNDFDIVEFQFGIDLPEGTEIGLWNNQQFTTEGNIIKFRNPWGVNFAAHDTIQLNGYYVLPEGYDVEDYLDPTLYDLEIIETS